MAVKNEVLVGQIVFITTAAPNEPTLPVPGLTSRSGPYNASVRRSGATAGLYIVAVGQTMGAPADADMDLAVSSTPIPGAPGVFLWTGVNVTDLGVNVATGDREYQLAVTEEVAGGLSIQVSDTPDVIIRFNLKRVNPRAT